MMSLLRLFSISLFTFDGYRLLVAQKSLGFPDKIDLLDRSCRHLATLLPGSVPQNIASKAGQALDVLSLFLVAVSAVV